VYFWVLRYHLAVTRYFDHDELAYLYWARHMADGSMPYRDFLLYPAPGLLWLLQPIVTQFNGFATFLAGRALLFWIFVCFAFVVTFLFYRMRKTWICVFIPLILVFLPLPSDKFLEIRPDMLAMFVVVVGMLGVISSMELQRPRTRPWKLAAAGVCFAVSLFISQKMLVLVGITGIGFLGWQMTSRRLKMITRKDTWKDIVAVVVGFGVVAACIGAWFLSLGNFPLIWYSLVKLPFEANVLGTIFSIPPDFFFRTNDVVYGTGGYHLGYWINLVFWVVAILIGVYRFVISLVCFDKKTSWQELIIAGNFLVSLYLFFYVMPMKHAQYLIPSAIFVVWYIVDGLFLIWEQMRTSRIGRLFGGIGFVVFLFVLLSANRLVSDPKMQWGYTEREELDMFLRTIPKTTYVLDLACVSLYYPSPYYITCMPIGQVTPLISLTLPSVEERLQATDTKYIYQGKQYRTQELSSNDQRYIREHFTPVGDGAMLVRNDVMER